MVTLTGARTSPAPPAPASRYSGQVLPGPEVVGAVDRIEPQAVQMVLAYPVESVGDQAVAHSVAAGSVEVDGISPGER